MACGQARLPASQVSLMLTTITEILSSGDKKFLTNTQTYVIIKTQRTKEINNMELNTNAYKNVKSLVMKMPELPKKN